MRSDERRPSGDEEGFTPQVAGVVAGLGLLHSSVSISDPERGRLRVRGLSFSGACLVNACRSTSRKSRGV